MCGAPTMLAREKTRCIVPNPRPDAAAVPGMSAFARLDLSDERFEIVAPVIDML